MEDTAGGALLDQGKYWRVREQLLSVEGFVEFVVARHGGHQWRAQAASTRTERDHDRTRLVD
jgi:hypothetical protein